MARSLSIADVLPVEIFVFDVQFLKSLPDKGPAFRGNCEKISAFMIPDILGDLPGEPRPALME